MTDSPVKLVSLLTDFGEQDGYTGVMKAVMLGIAPGMTIIDLTHEVKPQDIHGAAFLLQHHMRFYPPGTLHVCVVDPGVGSDRRILAVEAQEQFFLAPDNGLLSFLQELGETRIHEVSNEKLRLEQVSMTFHGRDIFAPAAAHLFNGVPLEKLGPRLKKMTRLRLPAAEIDRKKKKITGSIIYVDRFGNLITNISADMLPVPAEKTRVTFGPVALGTPKSHYAASEPGTVSAVFGSFEKLEIAVANSSAAQYFPDYATRSVVINWS